MEITFKNVVDVFNDDGDYISEYTILRKYSNLKYPSEAISNFIADGSDTEAIHNLGISGGYITLNYEGGYDSVIASTTNTVPDDLTKEQAKVLYKYTKGQWSDGIGSGLGGASFPELEGYHAQVSSFYDHEASYNLLLDGKNAWDSELCNNGKEFLEHIFEISIG